MTSRTLNLLVVLSALIVAAVAMSGDAQKHIRTTVMFVIGWNAPTGQIIYLNALPYDDLYSCEEDRDDITPNSNRIIGYYSLCVSPTDKST